VTGTAPTAALVDAVATTGKKAAVAGKSSVDANNSFLSAVAQFTHNTIKGVVLRTCVNWSLNCRTFVLYCRLGAIYGIASTSIVG
jgi:ApbE superfamily uncharacterized protein (UPF0280 family)